MSDYQKLSSLSSNWSRPWPSDHLASISKCWMTREHHHIQQILFYQWLNCLSVETKCHSIGYIWLSIIHHSWCHLFLFLLSAREATRKMLDFKSHCVSTHSVMLVSSSWSFGSWAPPLLSVRPTAPAALNSLSSPVDPEGLELHLAEERKEGFSNFCSSHQIKPWW